MKKGLTIKIFYFFLLILILFLVLITAMHFIQRRQIFESKAKTGNVVLSFNPRRISIFQNSEEFNISVIISSSSDIKITATMITINYPSFLELISIYPGNFFEYPENTEMLTLGTSCNKKDDCRTSADSVNCINGFCITENFPYNTQNSLTFALGASCTKLIKDQGEGKCYPRSGEGILANLRFRVKHYKKSVNLRGSISFDQKTHIVGLNSQNQPIQENLAKIKSNANVRVISYP